MSDTTTNSPSRSERYEELLDAAAECFQSRGFDATSIDTVARHLGATKGRVYHYFPSKMDLFNAVRDRGMDIVFQATDPGYQADLPVLDRLEAMARGHVRAMLFHHSFMLVLKDGLLMRRYTTTTEFQKESLFQHIARRDAYEARFRELLAKGLAEGSLRAGPDPAITVQTFMSALNGPVAWFRPRPGDTPQKYEAIVEEIVRFAMQGLRAYPS